MKPLLICLFFAICLNISSEIKTELKDDQSKLLFENYSSMVGQIEVIEKVSGKRCSIGSGFYINANGYIISNYHVISDVIHHPNKFHLEFITHDEVRDSLSILGFDVINDLAVLQNTNESNGLLILNDSDLKKGMKLYSLGNPRDLGLSIIEGTYNGLLEDRRIENIFFSGTLNPGMSGGPTINKAGKIVGVNVAKSGEQMGFLVPVKYLQQLLSKIDSTGIFPVNKYYSIIEEQLLDYQNKYMTMLLEMDWEKEQFGNSQVIKKLSQYFHDWGDTALDSDALYEMNYSGSRTKDNIYVSPDLHTGNIALRFEWLESDELSTIQFNNLYETKFGKYLRPGYGKEEEHSKFVSKNDFVTISDQEFKTMLAMRQYKKYPQLYDVVFNAALISNHKKGLILKFSLSGVSKHNGIAFLRKFLETIEWKN
ncbi:MAG: trypsin-like peptidase domain-containing protein [Candidatus Cloacimonetes bacterium]|nr:trypsin-like peptidase domain-containing protein [Candidatus Cloacimonadota bacterium]